MTAPTGAAPAYAVCPATVTLAKQSEGLYLKAYRCPAGVPTIGYGHTRGVVMGQTTTIQQAEKWLADDLAEAARAVDRLVSAPLTENQRGALASFVMNLGSGALAGSTLLRLLNAGRPAQEVADQFRRWTKATVNGEKVDLPGLVKRRAAEAALFLTPDK